MLWAAGYAIVALVTAILVGRWIRDDEDYRGHPTLLGLASLMGGFIWPLVLAGGLLVVMTTLFGKWLEKV